MLKRIMRHRLTGYVQLIVCSVAFIYGAYSGLREEQLLKSMVYAPSDRCSNSFTDHKFVDVKGVKRCISNGDAIAWTRADDGVQIAAIVFAIFLLIPPLVRGDFARSRTEARE